jgi:hypothetical protein
MELTEMQCNTDFREKFMNTDVAELCSKYIEESQFPATRNHALFIAFLFGTTYVGKPPNMGRVPNMESRNISLRMYCILWAVPNMGIFL